MPLNAQGRVTHDDFVWERCRTCGLGVGHVDHVVWAQRGGITDSAHPWVPSGVYRKPGEGDVDVAMFLHRMEQEVMGNDPKEQDR